MAIPSCINGTMVVGENDFQMVLSHKVVAFRGMTAGAGFATPEMKIALVNLIGRAPNEHPAATPTVFVDHLSAEMVGPVWQVEKVVGGVYG